MKKWAKGFDQAHFNTHPHTLQMANILEDVQPSQKCRR